MFAFYLTFYHVMFQRFMPQRLFNASIETINDEHGPSTIYQKI